MVNISLMVCSRNQETVDESLAFVVHILYSLIVVNAVTLSVSADKHSAKAHNQVCYRSKTEIISIKLKYFSRDSQTS